MGLLLWLPRDLVIDKKGEKDVRRWVGLVWVCCQMGWIGLVLSDGWIDDVHVFWLLGRQAVLFNVILAPSLPCLTLHLFCDCHRLVSNIHSKVLTGLGICCCFSFLTRGNMLCCIRAQ